MSFLQKAFMVNSAAFFALAIGVAQAAILSRVLGPSGIGQYALLISAMTLAGQLFSFGFPLSYLYHCQRDPGNSRAYLINTVWSTLVLGIVGGLVLSAVIYCNPSYFGDVPLIMLLGTCAYVPVVLQRAVTRNHLLIGIDAKRLSLMEISAVSAALVAVIIFALFGFLGVWQSVLCFIFAACIRSGLGWTWIRKEVFFSLRSTWKIISKLGLMGIKQSLADLMIIVNSQISILIIKYLMESFESVGYFSRAQRVAMLAVTAGQAVLPLLFSHWASFPKERLGRHVEKVVRFASTVGITLIITIIFGGKWIVLLLYGEQFLPAVRPMIIMLPGYVLYLLSHALIQLLGSQGVPEQSAVILFGGTATITALSFLLVPVMGINGGALSVVAGHIMIFISIILMAREKYGVRVMKCFIVNKRDIRGIIKTLEFQRLRDVPEKSIVFGVPAQVVKKR